MGQAASQIKNHIDHERKHLSSNLREFEDKVKSAVDWRVQFRKRPMVFLGLAFGSGVMLASGSRRPARSYSSISASAPSAGSQDPGSASNVPPPQPDRTVRVLDNIKIALIGLAANHLKDYVGKLVPGFSAQYHKAEAEGEPTSNSAKNP
jgi:hypothetical protein